MRNKLGLIFNMVMMIGISLGLTGWVTQSPTPLTCTWTGNNSNWGDTTNWNCGYIPTTNDDVVIPNTAHDPIINYSDKYVIYANNLTIQSGAAISVPERLEILASNVDIYGTLETTGSMDSAYIRGYATINNYGLIDAHAGIISIHYGGTHTGTFQGQYGEIMFGGENYYPHTFSPSSLIFVKKISFVYNTPINIQGIFRQQWPDSRVTVDNSNVTISNLTNLQVGSVTIVSGSLTIGLSGTTTGGLSVPEYSVFTGTGTVSGDLANSGIIKPGTSPGTINVTGNYTQNATGKLTMEIGCTTPGTQYDQLLVTGSASLDGTLEIFLIDDFSPILGDSFTLMTYASKTGIFSTINLPELTSGQTWDLSIADTELVLTVVAEPGMWECYIPFFIR